MRGSVSRTPHAETISPYFSRPDSESLHVDEAIPGSLELESHIRWMKTLVEPGLGWPYLKLRLEALRTPGKLLLVPM